MPTDLVLTAGVFRSTQRLDTLSKRYNTATRRDNGKGGRKQRFYGSFASDFSPAANDQSQPGQRGDPRLDRL